MIQDQFSDKSFRVLATKLKQFDPQVQELIKEAELDYAKSESLPSASFAWPEMRKFAIHTPEHTALSMIYAHDETLPPYVQDNLEKAAQCYELDIHAQEKVAEQVAEDPDDYMVPQYRVGKISEKGHVKEASLFFSNNYKKMDIHTRAHAAATLVKKAHQHDCRISPTFYKHAGLTQTNPQVLGEWLETRAHISKDETVKKGFDKLAEHVLDRTKFNYASREDMLKIADTIHTLDKKADLTGKYDITLPDPLLTVFNTNKTAEEKISLAGKDVPISSLLAVDAATYGDILGEDILPDISKDGHLNEDELVSVLSSLPADLQSLLVTTLGL